MANIKSAIKMMRVSARKRAYNKPIRSRIKTQVSKAEQVIGLGDLESARAAVMEAFSELDRAALKGTIHPNAAARRKARLAKKLNVASSASA